jgi:ABC-type microcin C transport system permease subunit YejE
MKLKRRQKTNKKTEKQQQRGRKANKDAYWSLFVFFILIPGALMAPV